MTKSTITREQLEEWVAQFDEDGGCDATDRQLEALIRQSLAAMAGEPVAFTEKHEISNMHATGLYLRAWPADRARNAVEGYTIPLYRHAPPTPERDQVRREHAEWSQATFGNVGPVGPLKHLSKEALEAAAEPGDLSEWADMQFLLWDAQRRAGITDEQITQAMIDKLAVNKQRSWPEPKDGEPRLHINEQPALTGNFPIIGIDLASGPDRTVEVHYVAPPGYVMVPKEPTESMINAWLSEVANWRGHVAGYKAMLAAAPQPQNEPQNIPEIIPGWIQVSERMPEDRISVILWDAEIGEVTSGHYSHKTQTFYHCGDAIENEITHWMPPPCAPQEVK